MTLLPRHSSTTYSTPASFNDSCFFTTFTAAIDWRRRRALLTKKQKGQVSTTRNEKSRRLLCEKLRRPSNVPRFSRTSLLKVAVLRSIYFLGALSASCIKARTDRGRPAYNSQLSSWSARHDQKKQDETPAATDHSVGGRQALIKRMRLNRGDLPTPATTACGTACTTACTTHHRWWLPHIDSDVRELGRWCAVLLYEVY